VTTALANRIGITHVATTSSAGEPPEHANRTAADEPVGGQGLDSLERPSSARIYDYLLGGHNNYAIDREFADKQEKIFPDIGNAMKSNRAFTIRAIRYAIGAGICQVVDIGSGLPSPGQAHDIADTEFPERGVRVVYVDNEPIAHAHSEVLLGSGTDPDRHAAVFGDYFDADDLWQKIVDTGAIDPEEPTCLLVTALLHFMLPATRPEAAMRRYRELLAPGSVLVLTHGSLAEDDTAGHAVAANYAHTTNPDTFSRTAAELTEFFGDWDLVDPGVVWTVQWRPPPEHAPWWGYTPSRARYLAGVAVKPLGASTSEDASGVDTSHRS